MKHRHGRPEVDKDAYRPLDFGSILLNVLIILVFNKARI